MSKYEIEIVLAKTSISNTRTKVEMYDIIEKTTCQKLGDLKMSFRLNGIAKLKVDLDNLPDAFPKFSKRIEEIYEALDESALGTIELLDYPELSSFDQDKISKAASSIGPVEYFNILRAGVLAEVIESFLNEKS